MASEIRQYSLTIPAGTPSSSPAVADTSFPARQVDRIEIVVPAGSNGTVGFQIRNSGLAVIPYGSLAWVVTSGENIGWDLDGYIDSGSWQLAGYNLGVNPHTIYIRYLLSLPGTAGQAAGAALAIDPALLDSTSSDTGSLDLLDVSATGIGAV